MGVLADVDGRTFATKFNQEAFVFRHRLCDLPLFATEALAALARRLPASQIEINAGDVAPDAVGTVAPPPLSAEQTLRRIERCNLWLGLKRLASEPAYCALIDAVLDELQPLIDRVDPGMFDRQAFLFVSSPRAVVPYHLDPEHNFLFQLRGHKQFTVFDPANRTVLGEREIERHYATGDRRLNFHHEHQRSARIIELGPGDALHVPVSSPHHVRNRDEVNVSLSITFRTPAGDRRENLYAVNYALRRLGLCPTPVGSSRRADSVKLGLFGAARAVRRLLRRRTARGDRANERPRG
jgi:hypothetical protein